MKIFIKIVLISTLILVLSLNLTSCRRMLADKTIESYGLVYPQDYKNTKLLKKALSDPNPHVRIRTINGIGQNCPKDKRYLKILMESLSDSNYLVRVAVLDALISLNFNDRTTLKTIDFIQSGDPVAAVRIKAKNALYTLGLPIVSSTETNIKEGTISSGSGLVFSESGLVFTNHHVIDGAKSYLVYFPEKNQKYEAKIVLIDKNNDIAILRITSSDWNTPKKIPFNIITSNKIQPGEKVCSFGYPLADVLGVSIKFSEGTISSIYGIGDDPRLFQISNPIQPGNSGGPLFTNKGNVIGIVVSSLNVKYFYETENIFPQNVNFAIKSNYLINLIEMLPEGEDILNKSITTDILSYSDLVSEVVEFVVMILAYK